MLQIVEPWKPGLGDDDSQMFLTALDDSTETISTPAVNPYLSEVQAMEACVLDGAQPVVPLSLSRQFARSILAIYESARTGAIVRPADVSD